MADTTAGRTPTGERKSWFRNVWVGDVELFFRFREAAARARRSYQAAGHDALREYAEACEHGDPRLEQAERQAAPRQAKDSADMPRPHPKLWVTDPEVHEAFRQAARARGTTQAKAACAALWLYLQSRSGP